MARKVSVQCPVDKLNQELGKVLAEYRDDVELNLTNITREMGKKGRAALRLSSRQNFKKMNGKRPYSDGWQYVLYNDRLGPRVKIYNAHPHLPHLLENDHVIRDGTKREVGKYTGRKHIKPVADELVETYTREVAAKL